MKKLLLLTLSLVLASCMSKEELIMYQCQNAVKLVYENSGWGYELIDIDIEHAKNAPRYDSLCRYYATRYIECDSYEATDEQKDSLDTYRALATQRALEVDRGVDLGWVVRHNYKVIPRDDATNRLATDRAMSIFETSVISENKQLLLHYMGVGVDRKILEWEGR